MASLLTFTPYLGDTFVASAVARKIEKLTHNDVYLAGMTKEMGDIILNDWGSKYISSEPLSKLMKLGSLFGEAQVEKKRVNGKWICSYNPSFEYSLLISDLVNEVLDSLPVFNIDTLYVLHNTYPHAVLGRIAKERGFSVYGYYLEENNVLMRATPSGWGVAEMWNSDFIGDRISKLATGRRLSRDDFYIKHNPQFRIGNVVTLFPTTRGNLPNVANWDLDILLLKEMGYEVRVAWHEKEDYEPPKGISKCPFTTVKEMVNLIAQSDFIVCNDSVSFHIAWHYGVPAIVKMKSGFNREWHPTWVQYNTKYKFLPPTKMYEEEYTQEFLKAVNTIV
jgi:hypothetical protein